MTEKPKISHRVFEHACENCLYVEINNDWMTQCPKCQYTFITNRMLSEDEVKNYLKTQDIPAAS